MTGQTTIDCKNCGNKKGELLGKMSDGENEFFLHKCLKCKQQIKVPTKEGLGFA